MMLTVLGSSSRGNGYLVESESQALIIEAGIPFLEVKKALDFNIRKICGAIVSHSHADHIGFASQYLKAGIKIYASPETITESGYSSFNWVPITGGFSVGDFEVIPVELKHDVKCLGFLVRYKKENTFCFITDTHYVPNTFRGMNNIIIECNYDGEILRERTESGNLPEVVSRRVLKSHISMDTCRKFLLANDLSKVNNIVLIHLSEGNSHAKNFQKEMQQTTGKNVHIAKPGLKINFNSKPF